MKKHIKYIVLAAVLIAAVVFALVYTRPRGLKERHPEIKLSECVGIRGRWNDRSDITKAVEFEFLPGDPRFDELIKLFGSTRFKTKLNNLMFKEAVRYHMFQDGDFNWEIMFSFEKVPVPDGSYVSGYILHVNNFYGKLDIRCNGKTEYCTVKDQKNWLADVLTVLKGE